MLFEFVVAYNVVLVAFCGVLVELLGLGWFRFVAAGCVGSDDDFWVGRCLSVWVGLLL